MDLKKLNESLERLKEVAAARQEALTEETINDYPKAAQMAAEIRDIVENEIKPKLLATTLKLTKQYVSDKGLQMNDKILLKSFPPMMIYDVFIQALHETLYNVKPAKTPVFDAWMDVGRLDGSATAESLFYETIHTDVQELDKDKLGDQIIKYYSYRQFYDAAIKKLDGASSIVLKDVGNYGATLYLSFGPGSEMIRFSKKKLRWSDMALVLFGVNRIDNPDEAEYIGKELMKHGLIKLK